MAALYCFPVKETKTSDSPLIPTTSSQELNIKHGVFTFSSREEYEKTLETSFNEKQAIITSLKSKKDYTMLLTDFKRSTARLSDAATDSLPEDQPFLLSILNEQGVVQIGEYLYKLNFKQRKIFVLAAKDNDVAGNKINYTDLVEGNRSNNKIGEFSMDVDVLSYTDAGIESQDKDNGIGAKSLGILCWRKSGASSNKEAGKFHYLDESNSDPSYKKNFVDWQTSYEKYGVFFSLSAKIKIKKNTSLSGIDDCEGFIDDDATREYNMEFICKYEGKCRDENEEFRSGTDYAPLGGENKIVRNFWESGNGLHKYDLTINFSIRTNAIIDKSAVSYYNNCGHPVPLQYYHFSQPTFYTVQPAFYTAPLRIVSNY